MKKWLIAIGVVVVIGIFVVLNLTKERARVRWSSPVNVVAKSGMGKVAAPACAQRLIDRWDVSCIVVCGLAGGLSDGLNLGDVIIGDGHPHAIGSEIGKTRLHGPVGERAIAFVSVEPERPRRRLALS